MIYINISTHICALQFKNKYSTSPMSIKQSTFFTKMPPSHEVEAFWYENRSHIKLKPSSSSKLSIRSLLNNNGAIQCTADLWLTTFLTTGISWLRRQSLIFCYKDILACSFIYYKDILVYSLILTFTPTKDYSPKLQL